MKSSNAAEGGPATPHVIYPVDKDTGFAMVSPMAPIRRQSLSATVPTETPSVQSTDNQKKESTRAETVPSTAHVIYPIMKENDFTMDSPMPSNRRQSYAEPATASAPAAAAPTAEATVPNKRLSMTFLETLGFSSKKEESSDPPATSTAHVIYPIVPENSFTMVSPMSSNRRQSHSGSIQPPMVSLEETLSNKNSAPPDAGVAAPHTIYPVEKNADFTMNSPMQSSRNQSHIEDPIAVAETTKPNKRPSMSFLETIGFTTVKEKTPEVSNPATAHVIYPVVKNAGFTMESPMTSGRRASHTQEVPPAVAATAAPIVSGPATVKRPSVTNAEPSYATPKKEPNPQNPVSSTAHVIYPVVKDTSFTMESPMAGTRRASHTAELPAAPAVATPVSAKRPSVKSSEVLQVFLQQDTNPDLLLPSTAHVIYPVVKDTRFAMESPMAGNRRPSHQSTSNA